MVELMIYKDEARAGTSLIAKGFDRSHDQILRLVKKYQENFENFSPLKVKKIQTKGRPLEEYLLTEDQFIFLGTLLRNSDVVVGFKEKLVKEFGKARRQLAAAKSQHQNQEWITHRELGKKARLRLTDTIQNFVEYAQEQGSGNANKYYMIISRMTNSLLFIFQGKYQNTRSLLTPEQLITLSSAESIIRKGLMDGMKKKTFYKDIYKSIKTNILAFVEMHGKTEVIEEQLKLEEVKDDESTNENRG